MERISTNGEIYVKASSVARELGYTADYVGQLARGGKIGAQLVGRTWFVSEADIHAHKTSRYRGTAAAARRSLRDAIQSKNEDSRGTEVRVPRTSYESDEADVLPTLRSEGRRIEEQIGDRVPIIRERTPVSSVAEQPEGDRSDEQADTSAERVPIRTIRPQVKTRPQRTPVATQLEPPEIPLEEHSARPPTRYGGLKVLSAAVAVLILAFVAAASFEHRTTISSDTTHQTYAFNAANVFSAASALRPGGEQR